MSSPSKVASSSRALCLPNTTPSFNSPVTSVTDHWVSHRLSMSSLSGRCLFFLWTNSSYCYLSSLTLESHHTLLSSSPHFQIWYREAISPPICNQFATFSFSWFYICMGSGYFYLPSLLICMTFPSMYGFYPSFPKARYFTFLA